MLIVLRFVNEKPPRREAEIRKVVCVFGNDSKRDIKRSSMRRVHIDDLEELIRHSKIINTTKTFTMKKLHMDASLRLGGARRNRTLTSWKTSKTQVLYRLSYKPQAGARALPPILSTDV